MDGDAVADDDVLLGLADDPAVDLGDQHVAAQVEVRLVLEVVADLLGRERELDAIDDGAGVDQRRDAGEVGVQVDRPEPEARDRRRVGQLDRERFGRAWSSQGLRGCVERLAPGRHAPDRREAAALVQAQRGVGVLDVDAELRRSSCPDRGAAPETADDQRPRQAASAIRPPDEDRVERAASPVEQLVLRVVDHVEDGACDLVAGEARRRRATDRSGGRRANRSNAASSSRTEPQWSRNALQSASKTSRSHGPIDRPDRRTPREAAPVGMSSRFGRTMSKNRPHRLVAVRREESRRALVRVPGFRRRTSAPGSSGWSSAIDRARASPQASSEAPMPCPRSAGSSRQMTS